MLSTNDDNSDLKDVTNIKSGDTTICAQETFGYYPNRAALSIMSHNWASLNMSDGKVHLCPLSYCVTSPGSCPFLKIDYSQKSSTK